MEANHPSSAPNSSSGDPLHPLQPARTHERPFHDNQEADGRLLDPSATSQGAPMYHEGFQGERSSMPGEDAVFTGQ